jgi:hypothetical protein
MIEEVAAASGLMETESEKNRTEFLMISGRSTRCDLHPTTCSASPSPSPRPATAAPNYCVSIHATPHVCSQFRP